MDAAVLVARRAVPVIVFRPNLLQSKTYVGFLLLATTAIVTACSSAPANDRAEGTVDCEYHPAGASSVDFTRPTPGRLGEFDALIRVEVVGHVDGANQASLVNSAVVNEVVAGDVVSGTSIDLHSDFRLCLEQGREYYVLADERADGQFFEIPHPWATFPVINNRITLHPDMRKDELIGDFHGLDPVLFQRRFVEFVGRSDIEVD